MALSTQVREEEDEAAAPAAADEPVPLAEPKPADQVQAPMAAAPRMRDVYEVALLDARSWARLDGFALEEHEWVLSMKVLRSRMTPAASPPKSTRRCSWWAPATSWARTPRRGRILVFWRRPAQAQGGRRRGGGEEWRRGAERRRAAGGRRLACAADERGRPVAATLGGMLIAAWAR